MTWGKEDNGHEDNHKEDQEDNQEDDHKDDPRLWWQPSLQPLPPTMAAPVGSCDIDAGYHILTSNLAELIDRRQATILPPPPPSTS
jgi:hypothetical protein